MLDRARRRSERIDWQAGDISRWEPGSSVDIAYSNSSLHWLDDHQRLLKAWTTHLSPGGVMAIQMPRNHDRPSHRIIEEVARLPRWSSRLEPRFRPEPVAPPQWYARILRDAGLETEIWETDYLHQLEGPDPVTAWVRGSVLRPLLSELTEHEQSEFLMMLTQRYRQTYSPEPDGVTLFPFRRLFIVARRLPSSG